MRKLRTALAEKYYLFVQESAKKELKKNSGLWEVIQEALKVSNSTSCEYYDLLLLYNRIKRDKPKEILELGPGISTVVFAYALQEIKAATGVKGRITSMEQWQKYYENEQKTIPEKFKDYVDLRLSPMIEDCYGIFHGIRYENIPDREYDFIFIDGPDPAEYNKQFLPADLDIVFVIQKLTKPVNVMLDNRTASGFVYHNIFKNKFYFRYLTKLGFMDGLTKDDLLTTRGVVAKFMRKRGFKGKFTFPFNF